MRNNARRAMRARYDARLARCGRGGDADGESTLLLSFLKRELRATPRRRHDRRKGKPRGASVTERERR